MDELIPIVAQDDTTGVVRMVGVWNAETIDISDQTGKLTFWSRTNGRIWTKGETSGDFLDIQDKQNIICQSTNDTLQASVIYRVKQIVGKTGMTCHTGTATCFDGRECDIANPLATKDMDYAKMQGKVMALTQSIPSNAILWVRLLERSDVAYLLNTIRDRYGSSARLSLDCDRDTLLIRMPEEITVITLR